MDEIAAVELPTRHGMFRAIAVRSRVDGSEHLALLRGEIGDGRGVLVRVHSECLTGDVFGSRRCDCGAQLDSALEAIARQERGAVLCMRGHEGRGIGLAEKLRAYRLQDQGLEGYGLEIVERGALPVHVTEENLIYLATKRDRCGHELGGLPGALRSLAPVAETGAP